MRFLILLFFVLFIFSCDRHHEKEALVKDIFNNLDSIELAFIKNKIDVRDYKKSMSPSSDFQDFWGSYFKGFDEGFELCSEYGSHIGRSYYHTFSDSVNTFVDVLKIEAINKGYFCEIHLFKEKNMWKLYGFNLYGTCLLINDRSNAVDSLFLEFDEEN